jgi:hypothetical protein
MTRVRRNRQSDRRKSAPRVGSCLLAW